MPQRDRFSGPAGATALLLTALCAAAHGAAPPGPYVGVATGAYTLDANKVDPGAGGAGRDEFEAAAPMLRGFGGLRLTPYWAVEADYQWLAAAKDSIRGTHVDVSLDAWTLSVRPILPLGEEVDLYGRAGWSWYSVDVDGSGLGASLDGSGDDFTWGGGVDIHLAGGVTVRGDYTRIAIEHTDLGVISAGVMVRF